MIKKQTEAVMKYHLAVLFLNYLLEKDKITNDELLMYKKKLIRKYNPLMGCFEVKIRKRKLLPFHLQNNKRK